MIYYVDLLDHKTPVITSNLVWHTLPCY